MSKVNPSIALAGNPNVGKTTLFNLLTGSRQTVGNWPGVTVEHKQGYYIYQGKRYEVIDLPGIYSLSGGTPDEQVTRDYILNHHPDLVINIVDSSNLERNLYLSVQLMELGLPMLMLLSMVDITLRNGIEVDCGHMESHLGFMVRAANLTKGKDAPDLPELIKQRLELDQPPAVIRYDDIVEKHIQAIVDKWAELSFSAERGAPKEDERKLRWKAIKLIELDAETIGETSDEMVEFASKEIKAIEKHRGQDSPAVIADDRYGYIRGLVKDVLARHKANKETYSDRVDKIVLSGLWGLPLFFGVMYLVFLLAVRASEPLIGFIDTGLTWLVVEQWGALLRSLGLVDWAVFMLADALGGGIVTIGTFIPPIFFIFTSLSILEDSGYMARAAFIADRFMRRIGLPGKAFIPLLVGFGCTVPAIMATRTLESKRDRVFASLLTPFMSCGAKLPVYSFLAMMFFPGRADLVIFGLYMFGVLMAMLFGLLLKKYVFPSQPGNFVMELPPYHIPTFNGIFLHTWFRLKDFVLRAGKTILLVIIVMNVLMVVKIPSRSDTDTAKTSILEYSGKAISPVLAPMGIRETSWGAGVALISGLFAKEAIVGTLQGLYQEKGASEADLENNLREAFGGTAAVLAYLVFILLYSPCGASLAMLFKEHGIRWMLFAFIYLTLMAWVLATLVYQVLAFGSGSWLWIGAALAIAGVMVLSIKLMGGGRNAV
jgi:ferrous iron transport protein B